MMSLLASLLLLLTSVMSNSKAIPSPRCGPTLLSAEIRQYLLSSPVVLYARLQEMIPLVGDKEFDLVVLVTQVLAKPDRDVIPPRVVLRRFYMPTNKSPTSANPDFALSHQKFGCLEHFQKNAKYAFLVTDTGEVLVYPGSNLRIFALSGPVLTLNEQVNAEILQSLCKTCYPPRLNTFEPATLPFGENFNATCVAEGNPLPVVMWYKDNYPVDIVTSGRDVRVEVVQLNNHVRHAILEIDNLVLLDNGDYVCRAKNSLGAAQSLMQLRVSTAGVSLVDQEVAMDSRDLEPCPPDENHCFNDGECFAKRSNPTERKCNCHEGFIGDQCQFRTSGIVFSSKSEGHVGNFWLQIILQFVFIALFGLIVIVIILVFRRKDLRAKKRRRIMRGDEVLFKSQYVQVNTIEPPPPPLKSPHSPSLQPPYQKSRFLANRMPQSPPYVRLPPGERPADGKRMPPDEASTASLARITSLQQPHRINPAVDVLDAIEEQETDTATNLRTPNCRNPVFL